MNKFFLPLLLISTLSFAQDMTTIESSDFRVNCEYELYGNEMVYSFGMTSKHEYLLFRPQEKGNLQPMDQLGAYRLLSKEKNTGSGYLNGSIEIKFSAINNYPRSAENRLYKLHLFDDGTGSLQRANILNNDDGTVSLSSVNRDSLKNCVSIGLE